MAESKVASIRKAVQKVQADSDIGVYGQIPCAVRVAVSIPLKKKIKKKDIGAERTASISKN